MSVHEKLGLSQEEYSEVEEHFEERTHNGLQYRHLPGYRSHLERGTVLMDGEVVRGYPKVPRTLYLETGIPRHFDDEVVVEEKLDGYNVRITEIDGEVYAFTRGGIICPYTTWKAQEQLTLQPFLNENPGLMLCGEMVGPHNPYTTHDYSDVDSLEFRAFDVRDRETGDSLPVMERRELCSKHGFPQVELHGVYGAEEAAEEVRDAIKELEGGEGEGVVMKSPGVMQQLKYTSSAANQGDLAFAFSLPFDYGRDFMFRRIIREAFQSVEWNEGETERRERAHRLGESILLSMTESVEEVRDGNEVGEEHVVRDPPEKIDELLSHLESQGLKLVIREDHRTNGDRFVRYLKRMQASNDKTEAYLDGKIVKE